MKLTGLRTLTLAAIAFCAMSGAHADATVIYSNDFQSDIGTEWSRTNADTAPNKDLASWGRFLGQFSGNQSTTLSVKNAPVGLVKLSFDTYFIRSWDGDGNASQYGSDRFGVSLGNGDKLLNDTFSNGNPAGQSYRGNGVKAPVYGNSNNTSMTGSFLQFALGYTFWDGIRGTWEAQDSAYHFDFSFYNTDPDLMLTFAGFNLQDNIVTAPDGEQYYDESWGLDNVVLQYENPEEDTMPVPEPSTLLLLSASLPFVVLACRQVQKPRRN